MSLSDCVKCWDTPCTCGWDYRHMSREARVKQAAVVLGVDVDTLESSFYRSVTDIPEDHPQKNDT